VPNHTELLIDSYGRWLEFFIPDIERDNNDDMVIICAGITRWDHSEEPKIGEEVVTHPDFQSGNQYRGEENIDILGLRRCSKDPRVYERVGRGRVVHKSCLKLC